MKSETRFGTLRRIAVGFVSDAQAAERTLQEARVAIPGPLPQSASMNENTDPPGVPATLSPRLSHQSPTHTRCVNRPNHSRTGKARDVSRSPPPEAVSGLEEWQFGRPSPNSGDRGEYSGVPRSCEGRPGED